MLTGGLTLDIRVLRYFLAVAKEESISGAANSLNITQPTLSRQLMDLEEELGAKLFIRSNRKITLTDEGMLLRKRAGEIVTLVDKTQAEFNTPEEIVSGEIYIGSGETHVIKVLAKVARQLQEDYPHIHYRIFSGNADDVVERLDKGLLDFGILIEPANVKKYDFMSLPGVDIWGVLMKKDSILANKAKVKPEDLWHLPLLVSNQSMVTNLISNWLQKDFEQLNIVATYNLIYNASILVQEGLGYAITLDKLVNTSGDSNLCFRALQPKLEARLNIVWKKYQIFSKPAQIFLNYLQKELSND